MVRTLQEPTAGRPPARVVNPEAHRKEIIEVATAEFAAHGLAGARVDDIAGKTRCSKRLIYYHFEDKEGLYLAVLEHVYRRVRSVEAQTDFDQFAPMAALRALVAFRFDHHLQNPDFVRLVMNENVQGARFLARSPAIRELSAGAVSRVARIYERGVADGVFRPGVRPWEIHWQISAMSFYNVSNRATFSTLFDCDPAAPETAQRLRANTIEAVVGFVAQRP